MLNTALVKIVLLNCVKSDHISEFESVFYFLIIKYKLQSASILKSKKQIDSDNMIDLLKKILDSDEKNDLINFDKNFQNLSSLIQIIIKN